MKYMAGGSAAAYQIDLLKSDVEDVHSVILDVLSRVGPLQQTSWKYPDRNGYDINITELLQKYRLTDDENDELIIQTALLELLIDRFLLLLHALSSFVDERSLTAPPSSQRDAKLNSKSAGLTARQYWRKIGALVSFVGDLQKDLAAKDAKITQLEAAKKTEPTKSKPPNSERLPSSEAKLRKSLISSETCIRGTQTVETAFRPCESCAVVQEGLRSVLDCVSSLVATQNVPSSVAKFKKIYDNMTWLSATDLQRLTPELACDLDKIQRQWSWLFSQLDPLRLEVDKLTKELENTKQELQFKKNDLSTIHAVHNKALKEVEAKWMSVDKEAQARITDLRQRNDKLIADKDHLLDQVQSLKSVVEEKQRLLEDFQRLQSNLDGLSAESQIINEHLVSMTKERDSLRTALQSTKDELNRSTMLAESMRARCDGLQSKQDSLLEQMSVMDRASDEYRIKISNLEGQMDATREHLDDKRREIEQLKQEKIKIELELDQLKRQPPPCPPLSERQKHRSKAESPRNSELQGKIASLQNELAEFRHKEMLLLAFPDPNGPMPFAEPSGDICEDLERQITATEMRSLLLQNQAAQLEKSLKKLREAKGEGGGEQQRNLKSEGGQRGGPTISERPSSASGSAKLFSKRSTTFVVRASDIKVDDESIEDADQFDNSNANHNVSGGTSEAVKQKMQELAKIKNELSHFNKGANGAGQPVQLWRVPSLKEDEDPVAAALAAYNKQSDGNLQPSRSRSNSYSKQDPKIEEALRLAKIKHDSSTLALPQLPNLPTCSAALTSKPHQNANSGPGSSLIQRAMNRQTALAAEIRMKTRISSAGKQRPANNIPPQPPSSPYSHYNSDTQEVASNNNNSGSNRLNWDLFSCSRCSKTYSNQRDLDIHSAYCNSGLD